MFNYCLRFSSPMASATPAQPLLVHSFLLSFLNLQSHTKRTTDLDADSEQRLQLCYGFDKGVTPSECRPAALCGRGGAQISRYPAFAWILLKLMASAIGTSRSLAASQASFRTVSCRLFARVWPSRRSKRVWVTATRRRCMATAARSSTSWFAFCSSSRTILPSKTTSLK